MLGHKDLREQGITYIILIYLLTTCTTTKDVDLVWEDFGNFYIFTYFIHLLKMPQPISKLIAFFGFLGCVLDKKNINSIGPKHTPPILGGWDQ
jgi:hypothetical protein